MCGIVGAVGIEHPDPTWLLKQMCNQIKHRGPDGEGYFQSNRALLGMRRLAIIDVSGGNQPIFNENRDVVTVLNGEIYNFRELRNTLHQKGHSFSTNSDTEVIVHLYEEYGEDFVSHLDGMFAFALWDIKREKLIIGRDRFGKKPLYYAVSSNSLVFASELKSLVAVGLIDREVDPEAIDLYLTYQYVPDPWTIYKNVYKLPPASILVWQSSTAITRKYWDVNEFFEKKIDISEVEAIDEFKKHLLRSTRTRLISERPVGAFLSGGLDSSAVAWAMTEAAEGPVNTYSIGFENEPYLNELPHAKRVAEILGTNHHEFVISPDIGDLVERVSGYFDEPFADSSAIPTFCVAEIAKREVVVALNGDGGDEAFGGYNRYLTNSFLSKASKQNFSKNRAFLTRSNISKIPVKIAAHINKSRELGRIQDPSLQYARRISYFNPESRTRLYRPDFALQLREFDSYLLLQSRWSALEKLNDVDKLLAIDYATYLPGDLLPKVDMMTMANSVEARSPFLDTAFVEWAAGLPSELKINQGTGKYIMKKALSTVFPQDLIYRPKQGFAIPREEWLAGPLQDMLRDLLLSSNSSLHTIFEKEEIRRMIEEQRKNQGYGSRLWALLMLQIWYNK